MIFCISTQLAEMVVVVEMEVTGKEGPWVIPESMLLNLILVAMAAQVGLAETAEMRLVDLMEGLEDLLLLP
jgi:hypothetical protein